MLTQGLNDLKRGGYVEKRAIKREEKALFLILIVLEHFFKIY